MEKMHLVVDLEKCVGCFNCLLACKDEHVENSWLPYTGPQQKHDQKWIGPERFERGVVPFTEGYFVNKLCRHCGNAACERAFPDAVSRREDGIVLLDPEKAKDAKALVDACPYGMISWNEEIGAAQKCTMCAHLIDDGWKEPRCVQACPLRALSIVFCEDAEFEERAKNQGLAPLEDGDNKPRVLYKNLYRHKTCFVAGALACIGEAGEERAAIGATVQLRQGGELVAECKTDFFGEFKIDNIPKSGGAYELTCLMDSYEPVIKEITVEGESLCLDVVTFK